MTLEERITQLEARLAATEARIAHLECAIRRNGTLPTPLILWVQPKRVPQTPLSPLQPPIWCATDYANWGDSA